MATTFTQVNKLSGMTLNVVHKDADGNRQNITGYVFELYLQSNDTNTGYELKKTVTSHDNAAQGETHFVLTTTDLEPLSGLYNMFVIVKETAEAIGRASQNGTLEVV